jgi:gas vesicle protein
MNNDQKPSDMKFWAGFFIGGLLGAIVLFFLGTKDGKRTGKMIEEKGHDLLDDLMEKVEEFEKKGKELMREGEKMKESVVEKLEEKGEKFSAEASVRLDEALLQIEEIQEKGRESTASLRKKLFKNLPKRS